MTIWSHVSKSSSMQSFCHCFLNRRREALRCTHLPHTTVFSKGFKVSARHLLCMESLSSDHSRILCKHFYCNSGGHSIGSIQKNAAHWPGAMERVEFIHPTVPCHTPFCFACLELPWACKLKLQPHCRGQQHESTVQEALVTMNKQWNAFFFKLLIPLGISEPSVGNIHLVKKWCHLWHWQH